MNSLRPYASLRVPQELIDLFIRFLIFTFFYCFLLKITRSSLQSLIPLLFVCLFASLTCPLNFPACFVLLSFSRFHNTNYLSISVPITTTTTTIKLYLSFSSFFPLYPSLLYPSLPFPSLPFLFLLLLLLLLLLSTTTPHCLRDQLEGL